MDGGDLAAAHRLLDTLALESGALTPGKRRCWYAKAALALADDRPTATLSLLDELDTRTPNLGDTAVLPRASLLRGTALSALGRHSEAEDVLRVARAGAVLWRSPTLTWRVDAELGRLHRRQRRRDDADAAFDSARTISNQLASRIDDPTLRATFDLVVSGLVPPESPRRRRRAELGGLTERETEVATLVAKGLTNRQIGVRLFVSESTVESHVKHVLSKLEFASRAQIAVWAAARSLAEESDIPD
jgi:DNA-binding NarL/FixJ family response regulator